MVLSVYEKTLSKALYRPQTLARKALPTGVPGVLRPPLLAMAMRLPETN
jgi:hypothetical protein